MVLNEEKSSTGKRRLPRCVALFFAVAVSANAFGLIVQVVLWGLIRHRGWPYTSPFLDEGIGVDLRNFAPLFSRGVLHSPAFFHQPVPFMYPAPVAPLYGLFFSLPHSVVSLELSLTALSVGTAILFAWRLAKAGVALGIAAGISAGALLLSYPLAFELKQGNMELFVALLVGAGVWCFWRGNFHGAAAILGVAAAMKIFPFVYLALFVSRRKWSALAMAAAVGVVVTLASLRYLSPHPLFAWHGIGADLDFYRTYVALPKRRETGYDHSVFGLFKVAYALTHRNQKPPVELMGRALGIYLPVAALSGIFLWVLRIRKMPFANQLLCLTVASITLSPVSFDYTLIHLSVPAGVLVFFAWEAGSREVPGLRATFVSLALLTATESELIVHGNSVGGQFKALGLVATFALGLVFPFRFSRLFDKNDIRPHPSELSCGASPETEGDIHVLPLSLGYKNAEGEHLPQ